MKLIKRTQKFLSASCLSFALMVATPVPASGSLFNAITDDTVNFATTAQSGFQMPAQVFENMQQTLELKETIKATVEEAKSYKDYLSKESEKTLNNFVEDSESTVDIETLQKIYENCDKILEQIKKAKELDEQQKREAYLADIGNKIEAAAYSTTYSVGGMCAAYVSHVFQNAGYGYIGGNANDMYYQYCNLTDRNAMREGMIIAVASHDATGWAGLQFGHIGCLIEKDGQFYVRDNVGYLQDTPVDQWIDLYNGLMEVKWGWCINV